MIDNYIFNHPKFPTILTFHHILIKFVKIIKKLYIVSINFVILMERLLLKVFKSVFLINQIFIIMENIKFTVSPYQDELQLLIDGKKAGYMSIEVDGRLLIVYYTKLDEEREGKGYAKLLLDELVRYAEEKDLLVDPECDFVRQQFENHPRRYKDIWHA